MLVAITDRPDLMHVQQAACNATPLHGMHPVVYTPLKRFEQIFALGVKTVAVVTLDLALCVSEPDFLEELATWRRDNDSAVVVALKTLPDKEAQGDLLFGLGARPHDEVLTMAAALQLPTWIRILTGHPVRRVLQEVQSDFDKALPPDLPNRNVVLHLLQRAPTGDNVDRIAATLGDPTLNQATRRGQIWELLRAAGQAPAKDLLTGFKVTLHSKMVAAQQHDRKLWRPERRAAMLGFPDSRAMRKSFSNRTGLSYTQLSQLEYGRAFETCLRLLYPGGTLSLRDLMRAAADTAIIIETTAAALRDYVPKAAVRAAGTAAVLLATVFMYGGDLITRVAVSDDDTPSEWVDSKRLASSSLAGVSIRMA